MKVGIITHFDAAHRLPAYKGKCEKVHGHTYKVEVTVEGELKEEKEYVIDYLELKTTVNDVLSKLDHEFLNDIFENPTSEIIANYIKTELEKELRDVKLSSVKLWEGEGKWVMID